MAVIAPPLITAEQAIAKAIEIDDHFDRLEFLRAWNEGNWRIVADFIADDEVDDES